MAQEIEVTSLTDTDLKNMLRLVAPEIPPMHKMLADNIINDVKEEYNYIMKKTSYEFKPGMEPVFYSTPRAVFTEGEVTFQQSKESVHSNLFLSDPQVVKTLMEIADECRKVEGTVLLNLNLKFPLDLNVFCEKQKDSIMKGIFQLTEYVKTPLTLFDHR